MSISLESSTVGTVWEPLIYRIFTVDDMHEARSRKRHRDLARGTERW